MINLNDIYSVTDFQRNPKSILERLKAGRGPAVLTVKGKAEFVVQDAASYQKLLDQVHASQDLEAVREGLAQSLAGAGRPAERFFTDFEKKNGL